jgi:hypothetical protein
LRRYEEDRQEGLATKRRESERIYSRQLFEDFQTAWKIRETDDRKRMAGILGFDIMSEISNQMATGRLTPVMTIDREGSISIRCELTNRENESLAANQNDLSVRQFQDILAILAEAQSEFIYYFIRLMKARKHNFDVTDEELVQMFAGGVKVSQANNSRAEQSSIEEKPQVVSGQSSRVEEKNDNHCDGQEEKTSRKEPGLDDFVNLSSSNCEMCSNMATPAPPPPIDSALFHSKSQASQMSSRKLKPLGKESGQEVKQGGPPDQYSSRLPRPQEHSSSSHDYGAQQDRVTDEEIKKELEDAAKTQIIAIQKIKNGKTGRTNFGQSFYPVPGSRY